jgi:hypothetical protein
MPFKITKILGVVVYHLALPSSLYHMHAIFHLSFLGYYISNFSHVIDLI